MRFRRVKSTFPGSVMALPAMALVALLSAAPLLPAQSVGGRRPAIDLMLSGHTHGGQICIPGLGPVFTAARSHRRLARGTHDVNGTILHTNRGLGLEGLGAPRMRFWARPEITVIELVSRKEGISH